MYCKQTLSILILLSAQLSFIIADCGDVKVKLPTRLIFNGTTSYHGQWPWFSSIFIKPNRYICGSSIISQWHLLTAAHCIISDRVEDFYALIGHFNLSNSNERHWQRRNMSNVYVHTDYSEENGRHMSKGDIAIFKVTQIIEYNDFVQPICMPQPTNDEINARGFVTGYGVTRPIQNHNEITPSHVELESIDQWTCLEKSNSYDKVVSRNSFCLRIDTGIPCRGDSGGGFYVYNSRTFQYTIYGVVSHSIGDCDPREYVVFVDVSKYIPWIQEMTTKSNNSTTATMKPDPTYGPDLKHPKCTLPATPEYEVDFATGGYRFGTKSYSYIEFTPNPNATRNYSDFSLTFRTDKQNGLLFYASDGRHDFISVFLKDGYINHVCKCGGNSMTIKLDKQYDNNVWHTITFTTVSKKISLKEENGESKEEEIKLRCLNVNFNKNYFVGGGSENVLEDIELNLNFEKGYYAKNSFFGCIKDVKFKSIPIELAEIPSDAVLPCSDNIENGIFFGKSGGYLKLREKFNVGTDLTFSMEIKPRNLTGVLFNVHGKKKTYLIVEMIDGEIHYSVDSGDGPRTVIFQSSEDHNLCDGNWHTVKIIKSRFIISINVDQFTSEPNVGNPDKHWTVDTTRPLFVGGHPYLSKIRGLKRRQSYNGCMRNFRIYDSVENITTEMAIGDVAVGVCSLN